VKEITTSLKYGNAQTVAEHTPIRVELTVLPVVRVNLKKVIEMQITENKNKVYRYTHEEFFKLLGIKGEKLVDVDCIFCDGEAVEVTTMLDDQDSKVKEYYKNKKLLSD